jgi:hypothetical protein
MYNASFSKKTAYATAVATARLIIEQIKRGGIEYTLDELREAVGEYSPISESTQKIWEEFLAMLKATSSMIAKHAPNSATKARLQAEKDQIDAQAERGEQI